jgi:acetyl-CoA carboxylase carboxyl transferase subunit beta
MSLKDWFDTKRKESSAKMSAAAMNSKLTDDDICRLWTQCFQCHANLPSKDLLANLHVCPECGYHFRIESKKRLEQLTDGFLEMNHTLAPEDPLNFTDTQPYRKRQNDARKKSGLNDAVVTGIAKMGDELAALALMDFSYMGGSMGSVVGEKITRLIEFAIEKQLPVIILTSSGGARMQEGTLSLMQMVKTGAALARLHEAGLLYITLLCEPTFGGVTASYGMLGDIIIAEDGARIGFAGRRVIEQTIRQKLPADFQTAGYLKKYGQVDMVLKRCELKSTLAQLLRLHRKASGKCPQVEAQTVLPVSLH